MAPRHNEETCLFVRFFSRAAKTVVKKQKKAGPFGTAALQGSGDRGGGHQNGNIFVDIEGFISAMFEQAELQDTQMGPNGPPNAKGTA